MSETLPSLTANGQKLIDRLLTLPQGGVTAAMLAESIGVSRRTVLRELPSVEQWIAAAGYRFVRSPGQGLLLDEPPNHLDITSKEILEEALKSYTGTVFFVSHDRYFINQTASRILELTGETVVNYIGNYDYYLEKHDQMVALYVKKPEDEAQTEASVKETAQKVDWQTQKAEQARIRKIENALKRAEEKIAELEEKIASIDAECAKPEVAVNSAKLGELTKQQSEYQEELEKQYEVWEELSMELDA